MWVQIKSVAEAESALDYLEAAASLIPGERVITRSLKIARKALGKGDISKVSKLINKVSDEIIAEKGSTVVSGKPEWSQNIQAGNKFNAEQSKNYPYNELYVDKPNGKGYYRLDSYNPATSEIVSRKFTQFSDISETTAKNYIREAVNKYPAGAAVSNVPSSGKLIGSRLKGGNILEVPPQVKPVPQPVPGPAKKANVTIRDTNGKVYK